MRVNPSNVNQAQASDVSSAKQAKGAAAAKGASGADEARKIKTTTEDGARPEISAKARDAATAAQVAKDAPDVREAKIAELKKRIAEGKYNVDPKKVADRMVDDHLETAGLG